MNRSQAWIYNFLIWFKGEHDGCAPTIEETIQAAADADLRLTNSVVWYWLEKLETKGWITLPRDGDKMRVGGRIYLTGGKWVLETDPRDVEDEPNQTTP